MLTRSLLVCHIIILDQAHSVQRHWHIHWESSTSCRPLGTSQHNNNERVTPALTLRGEPVTQTALTYISLPSRIIKVASLCREIRLWWYCSDLHLTGCGSWSAVVVSERCGGWLASPTTCPPPTLPVQPHRQEGLGNLLNRERHEHDPSSGRHRWKGLGELLTSDRHKAWEVWGSRLYRPKGLWTRGMREYVQEIWGSMEANLTRAQTWESLESYWRPGTNLYIISFLCTSISMSVKNWTNRKRARSIHYSCHRYGCGQNCNTCSPSFNITLPQVICWTCLKIIP